MKLEVVMLAGNESKQFLASLTEQIDRLEKLQGKGKVSKATEADEDTESEDEDEDEDFAPKKSKKSKFEDDEEDENEETEASNDDEEEDEEEELPKKAAKSKKVTSDDVNDAAKAYATYLIKKGRAGPEARKEVVKILKKKFEVTSVTDLEPEQYADAIKAFKVK